MSATQVHVGQLQKANANGGAQGAVIAMSQQPNHSSNETASAVLAAQAKALIEARYIVALNRPRDLDVVRQKLVRECMRPGFADAAIYHKPVGDGVEGLSIRFAEAAIRCMTNISIDVAAIYDDHEKRIVRVGVTDLEANTPYSQDVTIAKTVERKYKKDTDAVRGQRLNSKNQMVYIVEATDDEILNKENALVSKALRTQALRSLPGDIKDECLALCYKVLADKAAKDPDAEKRNIFDSFATLGVTADQIKEYLGHNAEVLTPKELKVLRGLYVALRDSETTWREIMDSRETPKPEDQPQGKADSKATTTRPPLDKFEQQERAGAQQQGQGQGQEAQQKAAESTSSATSDDVGKPTVEEIIKSINEAKTVEAIDKVIGLIEEVAQQDKHSMLHNIADNKRKRLAERVQSDQKKEPEQSEQPQGQRRTSRRTFD